MRKLLAVVLTALLLPTLALAQPAYVAGKDYLVIDQPVRTRDDSKVEVVEVFWYGCSHCYQFEPLVTKWSEQQPEYVDFWKSPAIWNSPMKVHARAFYTAKALGVYDKINEPLFVALVVDRKRLDDEKSLQRFFADYGVAAEDFSKAYNSFSIDSQVKQADARARSYKISGTPELIVNGKYRVSAREAGSHAGMLQVANFLIEKEKAAMGR
jgi:thiol:disulfide interchange protein DsbA